MGSSASSLIFDPTSPFLEYCTATTRGMLVSVLRLVAHAYNLTAAEATHAYLDGTNVAENTVGFKQLVNDYFQTCCDEYLIVHQQIVDGKKQFSDLNPDKLDEHVYCIMQNIMSQNDGYKHMNCIFDGAMMVCVLQFQFVLNSLVSGLEIASSRIHRGGLFPESEANLLRCVFDKELAKANKKLDKLRLNDTRYKNFRLSCGKNSTCGLDVRNEKQRQKELQQQINLEGQTHRSHCLHHH